MVVQNFISSKLSTEQCTPDQLEKLRDKVLLWAAKDPTKYDVMDVERVRDSGDDFLLRFVVEFYSPSTPIMEMIPSIMDSLAIRKVNTINDLCAEQFVFEMFNCDALCGFEQPGEPVFVFLNMKGIKVPRFASDYCRKFIIYLIKTVLPRLGDRQAHLVIDATSIPMSMVEFAVQLAYAVYKCYPGMLHEISVVNLPVLLRAGLYVLLTMFPENLRKIVHIRNHAELLDRIGKEHAPRFMGGNCQYIEYCNEYCPKDAKLMTIDRLVPILNVQESKVKKLLQMLRDAKRYSRV
jgi:hypothetical protein